MKLVDLAMLVIVIGKYSEQCSGQCFNVLIIIVIIVVRPQCKREFS